MTKKKSEQTTTNGDIYTVIINDFRNDILKKTTNVIRLKTQRTTKPTYTSIVYSVHSGTYT